MGRRLHHDAAGLRPAHGGQRAVGAGAAQADAGLSAQAGCGTAARLQDDRPAQAHPGPAGGWAPPHPGGTGRRGRLRRHRGARTGGGRAAGAGDAAADPARPAGLAAAGTHTVRRPAGGGRRSARAGGVGALLHRAARRRHRVGQDGGLLRGDLGGAGAGQTGAGAAAGNRAVGAVARPLRPALRRAAGGMAFGTDRGAAPRHLARGVEGRGAGGGRRAFGAVPALSRPGCHHRR